MKLFEQYLAIEDVMSLLRTVAKKVVQKLSTLPRKQGAEIALEDNCRIMIKGITSFNNDIKFLDIEVYRDNNYIGNIQLDFNSESPYILVAYSIANKNEGHVYHKINNPLLNK